MSDLLVNFCLNCNKRKCRGNCQELKEYMKNLMTKGLIPKRGGKKQNKAN